MCRNFFDERNISIKFERTESAVYDILDRAKWLHSQFKEICRKGKLTKDDVQDLSYDLDDLMNEVNCCAEFLTEISDEIDEFEMEEDEENE